MEIKKLRVGSLLLPSNVLMAPLAGYTCLPFRVLVYQLGAGLSFTEMASANALKYKDRATEQLLLSNSRCGDVQAAQLLGGNPSIIEKVAEARHWKNSILLISIWAVLSPMYLRAVRAAR